LREKYPGISRGYGPYPLAKSPFLGIAVEKIWRKWVG